MDYIIDKLFTTGFSPETKKETSLITNLKDEGFIYFDKSKNQYFARPETVKTETYDEIKLTIKPQINYLGLFVNNDNFTPSLPFNPRDKHILIEYLGKTENAEQSLKNILQKGFTLGKTYSLTTQGYGKNESNEGYKLEVPEELTPLMYKGNKIAYFTIGMSKQGKDRDTKNLDFVGVRPTKLLFTLGIHTTFGVFYSLESFNNAGKTKIIDKALLK